MIHFQLKKKKKETILRKKLWANRQLLYLMATGFGEGFGFPQEGKLHGIGSSAAQLAEGSPGMDPTRHHSQVQWPTPIIPARGRGGGGSQVRFTS